MLRFRRMTDAELTAEIVRLREAAREAPREPSSDAWARWSREFGAACDERDRRVR